MLFISVGDKQFGLVFQHTQFDEPVAMAGERKQLLVRATTKVLLFDAPKGTKTADLAPVAEGLALCSAKDIFNKEKGRRVALAAALKDAGFDQEVRKLVWDGYFATRPAKDPRVK